MRRVYWLALAAAFISLLASASVAASHHPGLAFQDSRPLVLTWDEVTRGVRLRVCNTELRPLRVSARLSGFGFVAGTAPLADATVLIQPSEPAKRLLPARCTNVVFKGIAKHRPNAGSYNGVAVLIQSGALVRRQVTITVAETASEPGEARSALEEVTFTARRNGFWAQSSSLSHTKTLTLIPPTKGTEPPAPPKNRVLGTLQHDDTGDRARLVVDRTGFESGRGRRLLLPVRVESAASAGTYSGTLEVPLGGTQPAKVKASVKVADPLEHALATILIGIFASALGIIYLQHVQPRLALRSRRAKLPERYRDGENALKQNFRGEPFVGYSVTPQSISEYQNGIHDAIQRYFRGNFLYDRTSEDYKKIVRMIQTAEDDAEMFSDSKKLGRSLRMLRTELQKFVGHLAQAPEFQNPRGRPKFVAQAARLVWPSAPSETGEQGSTELEVGQPTSIATRADSFVALIATWRSMAEKVKYYVRWARYLERRAPDMRPEDRRILVRAASKVMEAKNEMFDALDAEHLKTLDAETDLRKAYADLAYLGGRYGWPPTDASLATLLQKADPQAFAGLTVMTRLIRTRLDVAALARGSPAAGDLPEIRSAVIETVARSLRWIGDLSALALALAGGIAAGLLLYDAETFGTLSDYVKVLGLGAGAAAASKAVVDTIGQVRRVERA